MRPESIVLNISDTKWKDLQPHVLALTVQRILSAGARPPFTYLGHGAYGAVYCDVDNFAWKVDPWERPDVEDHPVHQIGGLTACFAKGLLHEFEFLAAAAQVPFVRDVVVRVHAWFPKQFCMKRDCLWGEIGTWGNSVMLNTLHQYISMTMEPLGWSGPEYKEDSFVKREDTGQWVLVDGGLAHRLGFELARYVESILDNRRPRCDSWRDLAFYIRREYNQTNGLPGDVVVSLLDRLLERMKEDLRAERHQKHSSGEEVALFHLEEDIKTTTFWRDETQKELQRG